MFLDEKIKKEIVKKVLEVTDPLEIILFGSFARGEATQNSDIDLAIIKEKLTESEISERRCIRKALKNLDYGKDIIVVSNKKYKFYSNSTNSVYRYINEEGESLWKKN